MLETILGFVIVVCLFILVGSALAFAIWLISSATTNVDDCEDCRAGRYQDCPEARRLMEFVDD